MTTGRSDLVTVGDLEFTPVRSDKARMFKTSNGEKVWLPLSQVEVDQGAGEVVMPEWLAREKGLI